jgi:RNA polymerase sigma-70 factor (ECF subfamily)
VAGHHAWHDLGRAVRDGQKGILIFAAPDRDLFRKTGARMTYVFDVSQTEGRALSERQSVHLGQTGQERLDATLAHRDIRDRSVADGAAYVVGRVLGVESGQEFAGFMAPYAPDRAALAQRLAAIQETAGQILAELLPEERIVGIAGSREALPRLDGPTFEQLHLRYRDRLVHSLIGMVRDRDKAEEIAARGFAVAWEKRDSFRGDASPTTWVEAIARNEARRLYRQGDRSFDSLDREDGPNPDAPDRVMDDLEQREERETLRRTLNQLPDKQRRVMTAHFVDGLSIRDIAQRESIPMGTVLSRIHSGKQLLREAWDAYGPERRDLEGPDPTRGH